MPAMLAVHGALQSAVGPAMAARGNLAGTLRGTSGVSDPPDTIHLVHDEDAMTIEGTRKRPISVHHLERLIAHALGDLEKAHRTDNAYVSTALEI
jgi:hypothetical protein